MKTAADIIASMLRRGGHPVDEVRYFDADGTLRHQAGTRDAKGRTDIARADNRLESLNALTRSLCRRSLPGRLWIGFVDIGVRLFLRVALPIVRWRVRWKYWRQRRAMLRAVDRVG